jgi:hypothetical protein
MRVQILLLSLVALPVLLKAQPVLTTVHGVVRDSLTGERLAYATVVLEGVSSGTRTDVKGNFFLESSKNPTRIKVSYVGYEPKSIPIQPGTHNELQVALSEGTELREITIKPKKYSNKNNPAVDLIEEVFRHKDQNRKEDLDYYSAEKYERLQLDLNNITDEYRKKWYFKPFRFIFNNVDTNEVTQKVALPFYLRERSLSNYYRKQPFSQKALLHGERRAGFADTESQEEDGLGVDGDGVSSFLNTAFSEVDIYEPNIKLLGTEFVGPLSGLATSIYRFYILDTLELDGKKYADVFFSPKNKANLAFMGNMLVALDSSYAVLRVEMGVPKDINLNFVSDLQIEQVFEPMGTGDARRLLLVQDAVTVDLKILKRSAGRSLVAKKSSSYRNYTLNAPLPDSLFTGINQLKKDTGELRKRGEAWWIDRRNSPLNPSQVFITKMVDSIRQVPVYKALVKVGEVMSTGYYRAGVVDIGSISSFYGINDIEGFRLRLGGRTNARLYKPLVLQSYAAYGFRDNRWKYQAGATYSFNGKVPRAFPQNQLVFSFMRDLRIPGLALNRISQDNAAVSFQRAERNRMLMNSVWKVEYKRELESMLSFSAVALRKTFDSEGVLTFELSGSEVGNPQYAPSLNTTELGLFVRFAPNQAIYNGANFRYPIPGKYPIFTTTFYNGFDNVLDGAFAYQKWLFSVEKRFFVAPFGISDWLLNAGKVWGKVPYPLLEVHPANQTYLYDRYAYNLMNFLEFVSDQFVSLNVQHNFNGLIFNRIPGIKKLQWREFLSVKVLYGSLSDRNNPQLSSGLFKFPVDAEGNSITHRLTEKPYVEISAGIGNLFKAIRLDYVWRINYREIPGAPSWGLRVMVSPGF